MKTTVILSCLLVGSSITLGTHNLAKTSTHSAVAKSTTAKRSYKTMPIAPVRIIIDKSSYELYVYDQKGWFATYPVVFGNSSLEDKKMEGDRNTPEGDFKIANKRVHEKWDRYMGLDYPTAESLQKFRLRKQRGEIPASASPGGGVGIHGTWPHDDYVIDNYKNWTNGCISLKNEDVEDLYSYVPVGTPVTIRK
ncbi:MAG TPA: L,D-transpeptidase [Flavisolibacter sp.]|jgi:lipoprotein-anchoring transpeptidase ErfK/SrfK|nr:L,D-transpeptidase [Flavisolibacter sp.]